MNTSKTIAYTIFIPKLFSEDSTLANFRIHHYSIERQPDGQYMIQDGRKFPGPVELIHHHSRFVDGFVTKPTIQCQRPKDVAPLAWPGFTMLELEFELLEEANKDGIKKVYRTTFVALFYNLASFYYSGSFYTAL